MPEPGPRDALLAAALDFVSERGLSDLSLRALAEGIGTSHRMLLYHFGSKEHLLVAIVEAAEEAERENLWAAVAGGEQDPIELLRTVWRQVSRPSKWPAERLFFELYGQALQGRPGTTTILDSVIDGWISPGVDHLMSRGIPKAQADAEARLNLAVIRGLLLDLLATGDRQGAQRAMDRYLGLLEADASRSELGGRPSPRRQPAGSPAGDQPAVDIRARVENEQ